MKTSRNIHSVRSQTMFIKNNYIYGQIKTWGGYQEVKDGIIHIVRALKNDHYGFIADL